MPIGILLVPINSSEFERKKLIVPQSNIFSCYLGFFFALLQANALFNTNYLVRQGLLNISAIGQRYFASF